MSQPFAFSRIGYVYVPTTKIDESIAWYTEHLSFKLMNKLGAGDAKYFYFRDNEGNLLEAAWSIWDPKDENKEGFYEGSYFYG